MGMFATVEAYCFKCQKIAFSQTKVPDDLYLQTIRPGDVFCAHNTPFATCNFRLKDHCEECGSDLVVELWNGVLGKPTAYKSLYAEGSWGSVDLVEEL